MDRQDCAVVAEPLVVLQQVAEVQDGITALFEALGQPSPLEQNRERSAGLVGSISEAADWLEIANRRLREVEKIIREAVRRMGE